MSKDSVTRPSQDFREFVVTHSPESSRTASSRKLALLLGLSKFSLRAIYTSWRDRSGRNRGIRVHGGDELGTDRNQRVVPSTHSSRCKRKAPAVPPVQQPEIGEDAIKVQRLNSSCPSRGDPFPPVLVMEAAENHASHNLAVLGKGMFVVILQRWEYRGTSRNPRSKAQMRAPWL